MRAYRNNSDILMEHLSDYELDMADASIGTFEDDGEKRILTVEEKKLLERIFGKEVQ